MLFQNENQGLDDMQTVYARAFQLSIPELHELTRQVGIRFGLSEGHYWSDKETYVYSLDEADDLRKVEAYLNARGV